MAVEGFDQAQQALQVLAANHGFDGPAAVGMVVHGSSL
jgi:hypothetical protein